MVVRGPIPEEKTRQTPRAEGGEGARSAAPEARPSLTGGSEVCRWRVPGFGLLPWTASLLGEDWLGWVALRLKWPATPGQEPRPRGAEEEVRVPDPEVITRASPPGSRAQSSDATPSSGANGNR